MPGKTTDIRPVEVTPYFLPVTMRVPLKFGAETLTTVTCLRVKMVVEDRQGRSAEGWGETPLSVAWGWPSSLAFDEREQAFLEFCLRLAGSWAGGSAYGHPIEVGYTYLQEALPALLGSFNGERGEAEPMPWLAALISCSAFDIALHDAYGNLHEVPVYQTYNESFMSTDLSRFLVPADKSAVSFAGCFPEAFLVGSRPNQLAAWHLVGGKDFIDPGELTGDEPDDGYPVLLRDWIRADGLNCLKIKLTGNDAAWDYRRLVDVGCMAIEENVDWLTTDFNCLVEEPAYVNEMLDRLVIEHPRIYGKILYVEQPFPYDLEENQIDVHSVSARKPLFMDESAHDWEMVALGRRLGWTGVALKTCKTQTGALLSLCWAKAHGMTLMVQDLTNPMLAQIPHVLLAAHAGTIMGVETNGMQFYPEASTVEAAIHPGMYRRQNGELELSTIQGAGFGYRIAEMERDLEAFRIPSAG